jgi:AraC-like DNA-binding protein
MSSTAFIPTPLLRPFIKTFLILESEGGMLNRVLPDTSLVMVFRYKGKVSYQENNISNDLSPSVISGLRKSGRLIRYSKDAGNILVIFKEAGARAFIHEPLHELFDESVSLTQISGYQNVSCIEEQLAEASTNVQRIRVIEQFLVARLQYPKPDLLILSALERIRSAKGILRIKDLAETLCISQDAFEKRFRRIVGVSPKQFSYIIRMRNILSSGLTQQSLTETAFNAGYFDQPHFNKDFKLFTGQTPTDFLKTPLFW